MAGGELLPLRPHHFALDALDSYTAAGDDPGRMVPNPAKKLAAARIRAPGHASYLTNQMLNQINAPVEDAYAELTAAQVPARVRLGDLSPQMKRLEQEVKQITHAIRMSAFNSQSMLAAALHGHYARAADEAYALVREALQDSGDIVPGDGELLIRLDPLTAPRRTAALAVLCQQATRARACYPGTDLVLRYEVKPHPEPARATRSQARTTAATITSTAPRQRQGLLA